MERGDSLAEVTDVLHAVFGEQLCRLYQARTLEQTNLLEHYQFASKWAPGIRKRMSSILGRSFGEEESIEVVEGW
ncbi:MAG TPA: isochorismatase, partial [Phycisphaerales bacterium]|nr:isochorismatase [Phycisphaerales bacterium]